MAETSPSLLERLRINPDPSSWQQLVEIYTPLIRGWLRRQGLADQEADDLVQEVLAVVVKKMPQFELQPRVGAFRRWLRSITVNCLRDFRRGQRSRPHAVGAGDSQALLEQLEDPDSAASKHWDQEHDRHVTQRLLEMIKPMYTASTWQAFKRLVLDGLTPDAVAAEFGLTVNAVFIAKSRVLAGLRREGQGLID